MRVIVTVLPQWLSEIFLVEAEEFFRLARAWRRGNPLG
jgi:hypothetical protein